MKYGIDLGRQRGKSFFWKESRRDLDGQTYTHVYFDEMTEFTEQMYQASRAGGKTLQLKEELEGVLDEQSRNTEEETPEHLRARWLSVRILQAYEFSYPRPSATEVMFVGRRGSGLSSRISQLSHLLPDVQFVSTEWLREKLLHIDEQEDRRTVEDHMATSLGFSEEDH